MHRWVGSKNIVAFQRDNHWGLLALDLGILVQVQQLDVRLVGPDLELLHFAHFRDYHVSGLLVRLLECMSTFDWLEKSTFVLGARISDGDNRTISLPGWVAFTFDCNRLLHNFSFLSDGGHWTLPWPADIEYSHRILLLSERRVVIWLVNIRPMPNFRRPCGWSDSLELVWFMSYLKLALSEVPFGCFSRCLILIECYQTS